MANDLVAGDTASVLTVTCTDKGPATVIDLTGATVQLRFRLNGGARTDVSMTIPAPATDGIATYQFGAGELSVGQFAGEVVITDAVGTIKKILDIIRLTVRAAL
jgi:hypothetical protein